MIIANVSDATSKATSAQVASANGAARARPGPSRSEKWYQAAVSRAISDSPNSTVVKPSRHSGN